jgi:hypothetical protein
MTISINQAPAIVSVSNASTRTVVFGGTMTNPSLIVVVVTMEANSTETITSVADDKNAGNYAVDVTQANTGSANRGTAAIYSMQNTQTAAATVTVTFSTNVYGRIRVYELLGAATSSVVDASGKQSLSPDPVAVSFGLTTVSANCAIFAALHGYTSTGIAVDSGFTAPEAAFSVQNQYHYAEYLLDSGAAQSRTLTLGDTTARTGDAVAVAYKVAASTQSQAPRSMHIFNQMRA